MVPQIDLLISLSSSPLPKCMCTWGESLGIFLFLQTNIFLSLLQYTLFLFLTAIIFWDLALGKHQESNFIFFFFFLNKTLSAQGKDYESIWQSLGSWQWIIPVLSLAAETLRPQVIWWGKWLTRKGSVGGSDPPPKFKTSPS